MGKHDQHHHLHADEIAWNITLLMIARTLPPEGPHLFLFELQMASANIVPSPVSLP